MKKLFFIVFTLILFSCENESLKSQVDYDKFLTNMTEFHRASLDLTMSNLELMITKKNRDFFLNEQIPSKIMFENLGSQYFANSSYDYSLLYSELGIKKIVPTQENARTQDYDISNYAYFTSAQKSMAQPFVTSILGLTSTSSVATLTTNFNNQVISSSLTQDEKTQLLSLSAATTALAQFMDEGGTDAMYAFINTLINSQSSRVKGCSVDFRSVWTGAVVGFFSQGAYGAYIGCTGGTVLLPGVGTATGCVGGAVFGAASGFVSGAIGGVASELLSTCFRGGGSGPVQPPVEEEY